MQFVKGLLTAMLIAVLLLLAVAFLLLPVGLFTILLLIPTPTLQACQQGLLF